MAVNKAKKRKKRKLKEYTPWKIEHLRKMKLIKESKARVIRALGRLNCGAEIDLLLMEKFAGILLSGAERERKYALKVVEEVLATVPKRSTKAREVLLAVQENIVGRPVLQTIAESEGRIYPVNMYEEEYYDENQEKGETAEGSEAYGEEGG